MQEIQNICFNILVKTPSVNRVILADKTGLTLVHISKFDFDLRDIDSMGAIASAVYLASEQQGLNTGLENMSTLVAEFSNGKILVASCGNAVLCLITDNDVALGLARMTITQAADEIKTILDKLIEDDWEELDDMAREETIDIDDDSGFLSEFQNALKELEHF